MDTIKDLCRFMEMDLLDILHGTANHPGEIENNEDLMSTTKELGRRLVTF